MTETKEQTVLEQIGGISGLVYSTVPILVFVPANMVWNLSVAIWCALGVALAILLLRLARREPVQPAISGFMGVGISALIAWLIGDPRGFFLFGIITACLYGVASVVSIVIRRPLIGVIWGYINGSGQLWRRHPDAVRAYDLATAVWALVFLSRFVVQALLYNADSTGWLAVARIAMGWPLAGVALVVTVWAVRKADRLVEPGPRGDTSAERSNMSAERGIEDTETTDSEATAIEATDDAYRSPSGDQTDRPL
ncbi:MAG: DUF3159 domain-containing protein [Rhodococcus sp.]|nr:DUF3159 domain-containing protein [Rhodococcus sp. (in: high G+C Gram-positive bacteria)]